MELDNYERLQNIAFSHSISLFGVASLHDFRYKVTAISSKTLEDLTFVVSMAFRLSDKIINDIKDHPTQLYLHHYRQVNYFLDRVALVITDSIQKEGYDALPIPASQVVDWENQVGHFSHRQAASKAGLGWIGRNNLLISPEFGARTRLVSVLTNFPLSIGKEIDTGCGSCQQCIKACPAGAIKEKKEEFDHLACFEQLKKFKIQTSICGICVKACHPLEKYKSLLV